MTNVPERTTTERHAKALAQIEATELRGSLRRIYNDRDHTLVKRQAALVLQAANEILVVPQAGWGAVPVSKKAAASWLEFASSTMAGAVTFTYLGEAEGLVVTIGRNWNDLDDRQKEMTVAKNAADIPLWKI